MSIKQLILDYTWSTGTPLIIGYLPALYPDYEAYEQALSCCKEKGLALLEIGIPCEEPYLDGQIISSALKKIANEIQSITEVLVQATRAVKRSGMCGIVMLYNETLEAIGIEVFSMICRAEEVEGVLVPNITQENRVCLYEALSDSQVEIISFIGFSTSDEEISAIVPLTSGFLYLQSTEGSTGGKFTNIEMAKERLNRVKALADPRNLPIALGFGISTLQDVNQAASIGADAVIIGTALVKAASSGESALSKYLNNFTRYLRA